jgi:hypothetical protein
VLPLGQLSPLDKDQLVRWFTGIAGIAGLQLLAVLLVLKRLLLVNQRVKLQPLQGKLILGL